MERLFDRTYPGQGLFPGDTIAVVAPSGKVAPPAIRFGITYLESLGYRVKISETVYMKKSFFAGDEKTRAAALNRCFADPAVKAILCARGGYGALRVLSLLDYPMIAKNPRPLIGFSDITALHMALYQETGFSGIHGPVLTTMEKAGKKTLDSLAACLRGEDFPVIGATNLKTLKQGRVHAPVVGGNLATLCHLVGTPWHPVLAGAILVLEETGEAPYRIHRMLSQMQLAGCLNNIAGVVLGDFTCCGKEEEIMEVFLDFFSETDIPAASGFPIGHGEENICFPVGRTAVFDSGSGTLEFDPLPSRGLA